MRPTPKSISLSEFEDIKGGLKDRQECPGELHVWTGEHPDYGYVVLIDSPHHGCLIIDGTSIIGVNEGIRLE